MKILWITILLGSLAAAQTDTADVYILSGQSNMAGQGQTAELPDSLQETVEGAHLWTGGGFSPFNPMAKGTFGPEVAFSETTLRNNPQRPIYLIKYAVGGRALHLGWDNQEWMGEEPGPGRDNFYPGEGLDDANIGNHYAELMDRVLPALEKLRENEIPFSIKGILWMQGEQDAKGEASALTYAVNLKHFSDRIHGDMEITDSPVPLVFGQVLPYSPALDRFTHRDELRQSQANADGDSGHEDSFYNAYMVSTDDMPLTNDRVHYNTEGMLLMGMAFAREMVIAQTEMTPVLIQQRDFSDESVLGPEKQENLYDVRGKILRGSNLKKGVSAQFGWPDFYRE